jgi:hypothetical protein
MLSFRTWLQPMRNLLFAFFKADPWNDNEVTRTVSEFKEFSPSSLRWNVAQDQLGLIHGAGRT